MDKPDTASTTILEPGTEKAKQRRQIAGKEKQQNSQVLLEVTQIAQRCS
jgi:hypothetical protein